MTLPIQLPSTAGADIPAVLLPYQQRWVADPSPLKVIEKSRRTGLTWGEAADDVLTAAAEKPAGGQNVYYIAYNQDMTAEYIEACAMWCKAFDYAAGQVEEGIWDDEADRDKNIKTYTIRFPSGHRIVALSSRPRASASTSSRCPPAAAAIWHAPVSRTRTVSRSPIPAGAARASASPPSSGATTTRPV
ncbi:hypothetical protein [Vogesella sp. EB]|uniref:hypothetical protein n=1 Tax=Vogesella sp. EB TaxID=1526735 RepID=UPI000AE989AC|nr:hypothetical protein [Vogesella sp. EB]